MGNVRKRLDKNKNNIKFTGCEYDLPVIIQVIDK